MEPGPLTHRSRAVVEAARLHRVRDRRERGETVIEGPHLLEEALSAGAEVRQVFHVADDDAVRRARSAGIESQAVDSRALQRLAGTETPRGPVAVVAIPGPGDTPAPDRLLVSWGVSDPGNVGTMIRTAAAFGWGFAHTEGTADPWSPKVLRAGAGSQFATWIGKVGSLADLRSSGHTPIATVVIGGAAPSSVQATRIAVLVGEEASGLPSGVTADCDAAITIPMPGGTESLNAAVAAGILLYALSKRPGEPGEKV